ncbi:MAG: alpha/beta fold hydrolase [Minisyncoccia bacterium]
MDLPSAIVDYPASVTTNAHHLKVDNCKITYSFFASTTKANTTLLFVHGHNENRNWWHHIAVRCEDIGNAVTLDLSGNGDSQHRNRYSIEQHAAEILAVASACSSHGRVFLVTHGLAYLVAVVAARIAGDKLSGLILVDPIGSFSPAQDDRMPFLLRLLKRVPCFSSYEAALQVFNSNQTIFNAEPALMAVISKYSFVNRGAKWYWKADPLYTSKLGRISESLKSLLILTSLETNIGIIYGDQSTSFSKSQIRIARTVVAEPLLVAVSDAGHHVFLDQPDHFIAALTNIADEFDRRCTVTEST